MPSDQFFPPRSKIPAQWGNFLPLAIRLCYPVAMLQHWARPILLLCLLFGLAPATRAETFDLVSGGSVSGEIISANAQGLVVKLADGSFAPRVGWTNFTQNALKELVKNPKVKNFVEPFVDTEEEATAKKAAAEINVKPVSRLQRPDSKAGLAALFRSPLSITLLFVLYLANLYAAFEVALFRNYPIAAVCGVAAVAPVLGPILFICLPRRLQQQQREQTEEQLAAEHHAEHLVLPGGEEVAEESGHGHAEHVPAGGPSLPAPILYQRGLYSFNRRFFETKMSGFLRVVPGEAEKDMLLHVKSSRGEHVATRISKLTPGELYLHVVKGGASSDVMIPYTELAEIQIRHKDLP